MRWRADVAGLKVSGFALVLALSGLAEGLPLSDALFYQPPGQVLLEAQVWNKGTQESSAPLVWVVGGRGSKTAGAKDCWAITQACPRLDC